MPARIRKIIFLAEDNAADVRLVEEALRRRNIPCIMAVYRDAQSAIVAVENYGTDSRPIPDLMLLDLNLPWGHGCDVLQAAAANPLLAAVPKAILSSFIGSPDEVERARSLGASSFILKPANFDQFMNDVGEDIKTLLERSRSAAAGRLPSS